MKINTEYITRSAKHYIKNVIGKPDPVWPFYSFEHSILSKTLEHHTAIVSWAEQSLEQKELFEQASKYIQSHNPTVQQGFALKQQVEQQFKDCYRKHSDIRLLIQNPDPAISPGGYSAFSNSIESFAFIGIQTTALNWNDNTKEILEQCRPTVLLATDHHDFLKRIDWQAVAEYRKTHTLYIGLIAHIEEYGNTPLLPRLIWAHKHNINFYFSFRDTEYTHTRKEYKPFFDHGYEILTLMFGANIFHYYPIPDITQDLDYSFIASTNWTKGPKYLEYAKKIVAGYPGFIDGYGWKHTPNFIFKKDRDRYIYARSKAGLNFHLPEQIQWACEVNERTHQLAACGIPQLVDNAKLLPKLYSEQAFFISNTGQDYFKSFKYILANPEQAQQKALKAQQEVFEKHTTLHRATHFIDQLVQLLSKL